MKKLLILLIVSGCCSSKISGTYSDKNHNVYIEQTSDSTISLAVETWYGNVSDTMHLKLSK